jgi:ribosomal protein S18 acetylase RimI-like enzyme
VTTPDIVLAQPDDLGRYLDLLEELADWLQVRGIRQWRPGSFRRSSDYYSESIRRREVHLALVADQLVGALRILMDEPIVWPEVVDDDAVYVYNLAVKRAWAGHGLGSQLLQRASDWGASRGRRWVRLDCMADNDFLCRYYAQAGFRERGEIAAHFPPPVGTLHLRRYEKSIRTLLGRG